MPGIRVADAGAPALMAQLLNGTAPPGNLWCRAFVNNLTPSPSTVAGDFSECAASGYTAVDVGWSGWSVGNVSSGVNTATNSPFLWVITDAVTIYGIYFVDTAGTLMWSQRFDDTIVLGGLGGTIQITPTFTWQTPIA